MYPTVQFIHSYWAYLVLIVLFVASLNAIIGYASNKEYGATNFRIALFTLITSHIQFLIGVVLYFTSPYFSVLLEKGMGTVMPDPTLRLYIMEHPLMMIIALVLITIGYSKHKNKLTSKPKFKTLAIFYTLGLLVMLSRIPWSAWF
ncbi:hypothetical protein [Salegentibacter maritimus]|uniref:50S ribosomal protein L27 n=1 Tax=Salegentibacter maritimus TaxID=2794347 RepID=A0ABS0TI72_9FLAO|nr:hypothetical protein [Salegentibacter maritimus]MBI6116385.1 hypothetical protein [Salegentibacter maritimus]MBI6120755.1 hypothetical protein [Salegentibacter maritimus]